MNRRAFTLIELLVTIAIISLLIGILLPSLASARGQARRGVALSNARSVLTTFDLYLAANRDTYPALQRLDSAEDDPFGGLPGTNGPAVLINWAVGVANAEGEVGRAIFITTDLLAAEWAWPTLVQDITSWDEAYKTWVSPGRPFDLQDFADVAAENAGDFTMERASEAASWQLSGSFAGDPRAWPADGAPTDLTLAELARPVMQPEVAFPSDKAMIWDKHLGWLTREPRVRNGHFDAPTPIGYADGHAAVSNPADAPAGVESALRNGPARPLADTPDGVRGRDLQ